MKLDWNFQTVGGGGGAKGKSLPGGGDGKFLELHNDKLL